jgi:hypothetical protein
MVVVLLWAVVLGLAIAFVYEVVAGIRVGG